MKVLPVGTKVEVKAKEIEGVITGIIIKILYNMK